MRLQDIPAEILEHFGSYTDEDLAALEDKITIEAHDEDGFLLDFSKVEEIPENDSYLDQDYVSQNLEHCDDQDHYLRRYRGKIGQYPYLIAAVHSSYDEVVDISSTYRGVAWFGHDAGKAPSTKATAAIQKFVENTLQDDFVWKLSLIEKGAGHISDQDRRTILVRDMAKIIRRLSQ